MKLGLVSCFPDCFEVSKSAVLRINIWMKSHLCRDKPENFDESFKRDYKAPKKLDNKTFWEKVFDVAIYF
jgi:hypothetical protein